MWKNKIHATVFCSPHNPCGRVWERWELEKAMELFKKHDVMVICDEIWSDIILEGHKHIPLQSISEDARQRTVALYAPSKTFNLAGLIGSYHIVYNKALRERIDKESSLSHYNSMNVLSMHALVGAYTQEGSDWVDELRQTITGNVNFACGFIAQNFPGVKVSKPQGTYMLFFGLHRLVRRPQHHHRPAGEGRMGRGRGLAGWPRLPRALPHPHEPGPAPLSGTGGL